MAKRRRKRRQNARIPSDDSRAQEEKQYLHDSKYGDIPLIKQFFTVSKEVEGRYGFSHIEKSFWLRPDPDFEPELPKGAVRGNVNKQDFCGWCHIPKYYYVDEQKQCVQCGEEFVFSAREQKYWYEALKFNFHSTAIRCGKCRRQRRNDRALQQQLANAVEIAKDIPYDPLAIMELAKATYDYYARFSQGNIDLAIAQLRKVRKTDPSRIEGKYWEGKLQSIRGNEAKAREMMDEFLKEAEGKGKYSSLVKDAKRELADRSE
jgi:hypothetical protein